MNRGLLAVLVLGAGVLLGACGSDEAGIDDAPSLTAALAGAAAGDEVHVDAARIEGSFVVPAGVTVVGAGAGTILVAPPGEPALTLAGGTPPTSVSSLAIEVNGSIGILARGPGAVAVRDVTVTVSAGLGIGAEDLAALQLHRVTVDGAVTAESAMTLPLAPDPADAPTHGVVLVRVAGADLTTVDVDGFGVTGVMLVDSTTTWAGGSSTGTRGTALFVYGGTADVDGVSLCGAIRGGGLIPSYGAVFSGSAGVHTTGVEVCDGEGYGVVQSEATATHVDLSVSNMTEAGVWVQSSTGFALSGTGSMISGNRTAGIFVIGSSNVDLSDATISGTRNGTRIVPDVGVIMVGDGVQLVDSTTAVSLANLRLENNERVGLLLDVGTGTTADVMLDGITVSGMGTSLGAVAQGMTVVAGWDAAVTREGDTVANDASFMGALEAAGAVSPTDLPRADAVRSMGLAAVTGP